MSERKVGTVQNLKTEQTQVCVEVDIALKDRTTGHFIGFSGLSDGREHIAIRMGPQIVGRPPLVRLHSECLTGDVFGSRRCDCGAQLAEGLERITAEGGYLLYLRQEGRGIGIVKKLQSYLLQSEGYDTYEANEMLNLGHDLRDYKIAAQMLRALDVQRVRLLTNNLSKVRGLEENGIEVCERVSTSTFLNPHNRNYLLAKQRKGHHDLGLSMPVEKK